MSVSVGLVCAPATRRQGTSDYTGCADLPYGAAGSALAHERSGVRSGGQAERPDDRATGRRPTRNEMRASDRFARHEVPG